MKDAFSTQGTLFNKFFVQRECMPFPGPPEEKNDAFPKSTLKIL